MAEPFARASDFTARHDLPADVDATRVETLLRDASTFLRSQARAVGRDIDGMIAANNLDADTPLRIVVDLVAEALRRRRLNAPAGSTTQMSRGPFSESVTTSPSLPDDFFLTRSQRRELRLGQHAGQVKFYTEPSI